MPLTCLCGKKCILLPKDIPNYIKIHKPCNKCDVSPIKKFKPLKDNIDLTSLNANTGRCPDCGKRSLDYVIAHTLKILIDEGIVKEKATIRRNAPTPFLHPFYTTTEPVSLNKESLILLHPDFTEECAEIILEEVPEIKAVIKGNGNDTVGQLTKDSEINTYQLLAGCDMRSDIIQTIKGPIVINKKQSISHIEFAPRTEKKIEILYNYLEKMSNKEDLKIIDGTCGCGSLGIFSLIYGANEVIFNDVYSNAINLTKINIKANSTNFKTKQNFKIYNLALEDLSTEIDEKKDLLIIDAFPGVNTKSLEEIGKKLADEILII